MKTYARIENSTVMELFSTAGDIATMFHPAIVWVECTSNPSVAVGWTYAGGVFAAPVIPPLSQAQMFATAETALQAAMDALAGQWGYGNPPGSVGSIEQGITYLNSTNAAWKAQAVALNAWRDAMWAWSIAQQAAIAAGTETMPTTMTAFIAGMPAAPANPYY
jgi:hypothetical protein